MFFPFGDPSFILLIPALLFAMYAQFKVQSTFQRFLRERSQSGLTGAQVARRLLDDNGLQAIPVEPVQGRLTDHYDPRSRRLRLSKDVYHSNSLAAIGVAAHEAGHAIQHSTNYVPLGIRNNLFPVASIGSQLAFPLFFIGLFLGAGASVVGQALMVIGIWFFVGALAFQVVTLPVELNASGRALGLLRKGAYLDAREIPKARAVLTAAALTYVAAVAVAAMNLIRLLVLRGAYSRRD